MASRKYIAWVVCLLLLFGSIVPNTPAQSGRKRNTDSAPPQPEPRKPENRTTPSAEPKNSPPNRVMVSREAAIVSEEHSGVTSRYVFKSGLTIVVREDHSSPIAACALQIKAGTANEPEDQPGVAQVVERLLTDTGATEEDLIRQARRQGGTLSSKIDFDATTYYLLGPTSNFSKLLELQFHSIQRQSFNAEEVARAAKLVNQDARLKLDEPLSYGEQRILQAAFVSANANATNEPKLITKEQAQDFYNRYYGASNVVVSVVGDVSADQVRFIAQQFLGGMRAVPNNKNAGNEQAASTVKYLAERADINQTVVSVGYRVPGLKEKESAVFEVLRALLTDGRGALLPQALIEPSYASQVSAKYIASNKGGLFAFQMQVVPDRLAKAEGALFDQIENTRRIIFSAGELQRAKSRLEKAYYDRTMSVSTLAGQLAFWEVHGGYKNFDSYLQRIKAVTGEQIQQLAAQYFNFSTAIVHEYEARNAPPRFPGSEAIYTPERFEAYMNVLVARTHRETVNKDEIVYGPDVPLAKQGAERHQETMEAGFIVELQPQPVRDFSTLRGPRAFVREDQSRPLLAVGIYFQGGRLLEHENNSGITELMLRSILRGTPSKTGAELALTLEQLGAEVKIVNEPDFFGYNLEVLSRNAEPAIKILIDMIENSAFDKGEFASEKAGLLTAVRALRDDGERRPIELAHNALYGSHPYGLPDLGMENSIQPLTVNDIKSWYQQTVKHQLPLVVLVGDTEGSALVGRLFADSFSRQNVDRTLSVPTLSAHPNADQIEQRERRQTAQVLGFAGPEGKNPDNYVIEVIRQIVAGPGGRFLANLRQQDFSFDLNIETEWRQQRSDFLIYINSAPDQEQRARTMIENEFKNLISSPLSDNEIEAGRNCAVAATLDALHAHGARALAYARTAFFGMPVSDVDNLTEKLQSVTRDDVRRVLQTYFQADRRGIGILRATPVTPTVTPSTTPNATPNANPNSAAGNAPGGSGGSQQ